MNRSPNEHNNFLLLLIAVDFNNFVSFLAEIDQRFLSSCFYFLFTVCCCLMHCSLQFLCGFKLTTKGLLSVSVPCGTTRLPTPRPGSWTQPRDPIASDGDSRDATSRYPTSTCWRTGASVKVTEPLPVSILVELSKNIQSSLTLLMFRCRYDKDGSVLPVWGQDTLLVLLHGQGQSH